MSKQRIVGEFMYQGELYQLLECGHAAVGMYGADGSNAWPDRICLACDSFNVQRKGWLLKVPEGVEVQW